MSALDPNLSRRGFLSTSAAGFFVQGSGVIRLGIIGCGGRGEAAAMNAMNGKRLTKPS